MKHLIEVLEDLCDYFRREIIDCGHSEEQGQVFDDAERTILRISTVGGLLGLSATFDLHAIKSW